jgi:hypothetical protein
MIAISAVCTVAGLGIGVLVCSLLETMKVMMFFAIFLFLVPFMAAFYFGYTGHTLITPIVIAIMLAFENVRTGWREGGVLKSMLVGTVFAVIVTIPVYYAGRWLGGFYRGSVILSPCVCVLSVSAILATYVGSRPGSREPCRNLRNGVQSSKKRKNHSYLHLN